MKIKTKKKDCHLLFKVKTAFGESIDEKELDRFSRFYLRGFLKPRLIKKNQIEYTGPTGVSLIEYLKRPLSKRDFLLIIEQIVAAVQKLQANSLPLNNLLMNIQYVYINEVTKEVQFIYVPIAPSSNGNMIELIESIVYSINPTPEESDKDFVSRFIYFFRGLKPFNINVIEKYIAKEDRSVVSIIKKQNAGQSGFMTNKKQHYYEHYDELRTSDDELTGLLREDDEATGLLDDEATGLLNDEDEATGLLPVAASEDTALLAENQVNIRYPSLYRVLTEETISVNKPIFRLGKEKSYVDYFVTNNVAVSRSHADIVTRGNRFFVIDLNSKNHTYINGRELPAEELINPHSSISGNTPVKKKTSHWYLPLNEYEPWLKQWILEEHKEWKTNVYGQCKSWLDGGLQPRAVSRDLNWGVPVPVEGAEGKVLYVWFDAPIGYISNTIELRPNDWELWWKDESTKMVHFIGKDNIVFHCIVFPSMLKAHGGYILPDNVPANEFLNLEGDKISTSRNWAIWLHEYLEEFPGKQDVLRYVLCANAPETKDNDFTWKDFQTRNNSELVAIYGNFVNRAVVLTWKYFEGKVPQNLKPAAIDTETLAQIPAIKKNIEDALENYKFREALKEAMNLARLGNRYLTETEPWKIAKTDMERTASILNVSLQICANLAIAFNSFLPFSSEKLRQMLNMDQSLMTWKSFASEGLLPEGHQLNQAELLFSKIEDDVIEGQLNKLAEIRKANEAKAKAAAAVQLAPAKESCSFDDFMKMDIRTATVLEAERVPKTDKLLKLTIDTGLDKRVIVSGIAEYYTPEEMVGKQICILANLEPRKIKGIESQGMILMARQEDGKMKIITPEERLINGSQIG